MKGEVIFRAEGISKSFGPTKANTDVLLELRGGEIHALAGENGSGKSTLISIICGIIKPDSGHMVMKGEEYKPHSPTDAVTHKIGFVVQELGLLDTLTVVDNMFLGQMKNHEVMGVALRPKMLRDAEAELAALDFSGVSVRAKASELSLEKRKMIEITKAVRGEPELLILDETTQALSMDVRRKLYKIIDDYKAKGAAILLVTHDLNELCEIADVATVLRDGKVAGELRGDEINENAVRTLMVGRKFEGDYYRADQEMDFEDDVVLKVDDLTMEPFFRNVSFELHQNEILGICGLSDGGIHELGKAVMGIEKASAGTVTVVKSGAVIKTPYDAVKNRVAYVPKDRDSEALMMGASIENNMLLPSVKDLAKKGVFSLPSTHRSFAASAIDRFDVRCIGAKQSISALSGGNKQKVSIGRWLLKDLDVLVMDCPTRGVDVSVKAYIYDIMKHLKKNRTSMILIADEMNEAIGMSDRVIVFKDGQISGVLQRNENLNEMSVIEVMV